jgi:hypothetical protein
MPGERQARGLPARGDRVRQLRHRKACHDSLEYQAAAKIRDEASTAEFIITKATRVDLPARAAGPKPECPSREASIPGGGSIRLYCYSPAIKSRIAHRQMAWLKYLAVARTAEVLLMSTSMRCAAGSPSVRDVSVLHRSLPRRGGATHTNGLAAVWVRPSYSSLSISQPRAAAAPQVAALQAVDVLVARSCRCRLAASPQ